MTKNVLVIVMILVVFMRTLYSLNPLHDDRTPSKESNVSKLTDLLSRLSNQSARRISVESLRRGTSVLEMIKKNAFLFKKKGLREGPDNDNQNDNDKGTPIQEHAQVVEKELTSALTQNTSALLDKPYVEKKGANDFLVMKDEESDPFVTVIPNAIYYNIEKKCVNWLDNCSLDGIRAKLFQVMRSPYR